MAFLFSKARTVPIGVVLKRSPGATRWAKWAWRATDILPGAGPARWKVIAEAGDTTLYHAATLPLTLYPSDTEAYVHELAARVPSVYIVLRTGSAEWPLEPQIVTASPYEGQDYCDSGEDVVERVAMPAAMRAWIQGFVDEHHEEEVFVKRRRKNARVDMVQDGIGDSRISQASDVYRAPGAKAVP
ncbi:DUF3305 domain-containing protein [Oceaniglobus trochenteri]|uniref:DUF3305 domain-containing protein n=1 Tax=Oceaniglobus trochenteri TaxID=2763260 RepID=UPI001CFFE8F2|nr:DUF3305 domain-containing protein [Oceaniglobus trochenteri]